MQNLLDMKIRLRHGGDTAFGPGKAAILDAINETGSISGAGRKLEMSYRRTWLLVDEMNRCFKQPLVSTATGGQKGGGAHVTEFGNEVLQIYRRMEGAAVAAIDADLGRLSKFLTDT